MKLDPADASNAISNDANVASFEPNNDSPPHNTHSLHNDALSPNNPCLKHMDSGAIPLYQLGLTAESHCATYHYMSFTHCTEIPTLHTTTSAHTNVPHLALISFSGTVLNITWNE